MGNGADTRSQSRKIDTIGHIREIKMSIGIGMGPLIGIQKGPL